MAKSLAFWIEGGKANNEPACKPNSTQNSSPPEEKEPKPEPEPSANSTANQNHPEPDVELHFNYWSISGNSDPAIDYLDIGVKFSGLRTFESIKIFLPFNVTDDNYISSLGQTVCNSPNLISAIFNTRVKETKLDGERLDITFRQEKNPTLRFHCQIELGQNDEGVAIIEHNRSCAGTTLSFPISLFKKEKETELADLPHYFRFRIKMGREDKKVISQLYKSKDSNFLSRFDSTEIVDFRVNEIRNLPAQIRSKLENESFISSVHFFLIRETNSEHKLSHTAFKRCRVLEKDLWENYLKEDGKDIQLPEQMLIYHWKEQSARSEGKPKEYVENFSAFAKFSKIVITQTTKIIFVLSVVLLGALSSIVGNYAYSLLNSSPKSPEESYSTPPVNQCTKHQTGGPANC